MPSLPTCFPTPKLLGNLNTRHLVRFSHESGFQEQMCARKRSTIEGHRKALQIDENPEGPYKTASTEAATC